jgi:hypothetical protein
MELTHISTFAAGHQADAFAAWRTAELRVDETWGAYVAAVRRDRADAFAAYVAALAAEEAAAADLAVAHLAQAA